MRSSDHPPVTLQCEQLRLPVMLLWLEGFSTILAVLAMLLPHTLGTGRRLSALRGVS